MAKSSGGRGSWTRDYWNVGLAVAAVLAVLFAGYAAYVSITRNAVPDVDLGYVPPAVEGESAPVITLPERPVALFFGDSYTFGTAADPLTDGYAYRSGAALGWQTTVNGVSGTGFVNPGPPGTTYQQRLDALQIDPSTNLVVIQGGVNDQGRQNAQIVSATGQFVQTVRDRLPGVQIVMFGPILGEPENAGALRAFTETDSALRRAADIAGIPFVDPFRERWINAENAAEFVDDDGVHLNSAGHGFVADRLVAAIRDRTAS